jgi:PhzF family phenazine biosynthesis protein
MQITIYQVNAFTDSLFHGNPAAVCLLTEWLPTEKLLAIAVENNLPVTAFLKREKERFAIRWFTPELELDLCGHGTLASTYIIFNKLEPHLQEVNIYANGGSSTIR